GPAFRAFVLHSTETTLWLDGDSGPLHEANESETLALSSDLERVDAAFRSGSRLTTARSITPCRVPCSSWPGLRGCSLGQICSFAAALRSPPTSASDRSWSASPSSHSGRVCLSWLWASTPCGRGARVWQWETLS